MTQKEQKIHFDKFVEEMEGILIRKGDDYAGDVDRLGNFKKAGSICNLTASQNCLSLIATKVARLGTLLGGKAPNNESVHDSLIDLANYAVLLSMIESEINSQKTLK